MPGYLRRLPVARLPLAGVTGLAMELVGVSVTGNWVPLMSVEDGLRRAKLI